MTDGPRFCVVIPVYNHGTKVGDVIREALCLGLPVIAVNDGSTDATAYRLGQFPGLRVLTHPENRGKGAALITGFREAAECADFAVVLDGDGQHLPRDVRSLIRAVPPGSRPLVTGFRRDMLGPGAPWTSRMGRKFSNFWVRLSGGPRVVDSQSGFRIYPLPEILELPVRSRRYEYEVEVLVLAHRRGITVLQAPVEVRYPPKKERISHFRPFLDSMRNSSCFSRLIFRRVIGLL